MGAQKQDRIQQLAESLKGTLDGGVDSVADKIKAAQLFAEEQSDVIDEKNQVLKLKLADFLRSAKAKGDDLHAGLHDRLSRWVSEIETSS